MRVHRNIKVLLCTCFFLFSAVLICLFSDIKAEDRTVPKESSVRTAEENRGEQLLYEQIKNTFPLLKLASMDTFDTALRTDFTAALFSDTFYINQLAGHSTEDNVLAENKEAAASMAQGRKTWLLPSEFLKRNSSLGDMGSIEGESYYEELEEVSQKNKQDSGALQQNKKMMDKLIKGKDTDYLVQNFFILSGNTTIDKTVFNVEKLLNQDCTMKKEEGKPQILIYHTHGASEGFSDSREGKVEDSVIGVGEHLAEILRTQYGYGVIHDETPYDLIDGQIDRNKGYNQALVGLEAILEENPSIEVIIDLHRDASRNGEKRVTVIDGKPTAQIMFFNGLSRNLEGEIAYLKNPNLSGNIAFSLKMRLEAMSKYPDFAIKIFLKDYRYNLHLREKSLLIELGNNANTVEEAKNAMGPLAKVLDGVLGAAK